MEQVQQILDFLNDSGMITHAVELIGAVVLFLVGKYVRSELHAKAKASMAGGLYDAVLEGVSTTYEHLYRELKTASADGKLSRADVKALRITAKVYAQDATSDPKVKEELSLLSEQAFQVLIEKCVNKLKSDAQVHSRTVNGTMVVTNGVKSDEIDA